VPEDDDSVNKNFNFRASHRLDGKKPKSIGNNIQTSSKNGICHYINLNVIQLRKIVHQIKVAVCTLRIHYRARTHYLFSMNSLCVVIEL